MKLKPQTLSKSKGEIVGLSCKCGGRILVSDWKGNASREYRWEAFCKCCDSCDPNGYSSLAKTRAGAGEYFTPKDRVRGA